jgi:hypothetical protein
MTLGKLTGRVDCRIKSGNDDAGNVLARYACHPVIARSETTKQSSTAHPSWIASLPLA